jgi:hypothetical protein
MLNRVAIYLSFLDMPVSRPRVPQFFELSVRLLTQGNGRLPASGPGNAEVLGSSLPKDSATGPRVDRSRVPALADLRSLRAQAYVVLAWGQLRTAGVRDVEEFANVAQQAARRLVECYQRSKRSDWPWFEAQMTYANAVLPQALFVAADCWPDEPLQEMAEESFAFLDRVTTAEGVFWPIGNSDWFPHGEAKSLYDQQPVEASTMADAALTAFASRPDGKYLETFQRARGWFHGRNSLGEKLADAESGGCCDGLVLSGVNRNQGAESTFAYLWTELLAADVPKSDCLPRDATVAID